MQTLKRIILTWLMGMMLCTLSADAAYYYARGQRVDLDIDSTKCLLKLAISTPVNCDSILDSIAGIVTCLDNPLTVDNFIVCSLSVTGDYRRFLQDLAARPIVKYAVPYYIFRDSTPLLIGETFCCMFRPVVARAVIDSIFAYNSIAIRSENEYSPNDFLVTVTESTAADVIEVSRRLYETDLVAYAIPNLRFEALPCSYRVYDYKAGAQGNLQAIMGHWNSATAWDITSGDSNLIVCVMDQGVSEHLDLPIERIAPGYDFADDDSDATPWYESAHGMATAGLIAATNTTDSNWAGHPLNGIASVAPAVKIMPFKIWSSFGDHTVSLTTAGFIGAFDYAWIHGAAVINCGFTISGKNFNLEAIDSAISRAYYLGRNGKGTVISCGAGNNGGDVQYPASSECALAVGAIGWNDVRWDYSAYGPDLDIVAPSAQCNWQGYIWSMDQMGDSGIVPDSVYCDDAGMNHGWVCSFGGTSAACPLVSGIAALLISRRPDLTSAQVYDVIRYSARTELALDTIVPPDIYYGWGKVDAFRALLAVSRGDANNSKLINIQDIGL